MIGTKRWAIAGVMAVGVGCVLGGAVWAGPASADEVSGEPAKMAELMKLGSPGEHHEKLQPFVGEWDVAVTMWMGPDAPPQASEGFSEIAWILGGRFLQEHFEGVFEMGGQASEFVGLGLLGYDNAEGEYVMMWTDSMSTALMVFDDGAFDDATGTLTIEGEFDDPMLGVEVDFTSVSRIVSDDKILFQMFKEPEGGQKFKCLEMVYTRAE